ncbi:MAG: murein L,D-transpeptidase catalytic domain family protein [Candidatus Eiseniibacteriota bacterium]
MRPSGAGELTTGLRAPMDPGPTALPRIDRTDSLEKVLELAAPELDPDVIKLALESQANAVRDGLVLDPLTLTVIDYSRPSDEARLFVFDLDAGRLLFKDLVAHGRNSGELRATQFSNVEGSFMTSLGLFRTLDPYVGEHGLSLRLEGLEPGFNDHAFDRGIVIHGADYVSGAFARREGRIGRSLGCPALPLASARRIIERIRGGSAVFSYFPEARWLSESRFFNEDGVPVAGSLRAAHGVRARSL